MTRPAHCLSRHECISARGCACAEIAARQEREEARRSTVEACRENDARRALALFRSGNDTVEIGLAMRVHESRAASLLSEGRALVARDARNDELRRRHRNALMRRGHA